MSETLHFKVSSGLKNIIGRELINDKYIAIVGCLSNIDNDGKYFSITDPEGTWRSVTCDIRKNEQAKKLGFISEDELGVMANVNYALSFEVAELVVIDYGKELKAAESKDISNFEKYEINDSEENLSFRMTFLSCSAMK